MKLQPVVQRGDSSSSSVSFPLPPCSLHSSFPSFLSSKLFPSVSVLLGRFRKWLTKDLIAQSFLLHIEIDFIFEILFLFSNLLFSSLSICRYSCTFLIIAPQILFFALRFSSSNSVSPSSVLFFLLFIYLR